MPHQNAEVIARRFGDAGQRFLRELPERLAELTSRWELSLGEPLPIGIGGFLVSAQTTEGQEAILKLSPTGGAQDRVNELEAYALGRWQGDGAVRRFMADPAAGALLLERCSPGAGIDTIPEEEMLAAGCTVARRLQRRPDAEDERLLTSAVADVAQRAVRLGDWMDRIGRPLSPPAARLLAEVHEELARYEGPLVVCHGDLNPGNLLSAQRARWLAIDPLPVIAPAAYDAVSLVWSKRSWLLGEPEAARRLSARIELAAGTLGVPQRAVWAWTLARATGILVDRFGWGGYNEAPFVRVVELLCQRPPATT